MSALESPPSGEMGSTRSGWRMHWNHAKTCTQAVESCGVCDSNRPAHNSAGAKARMRRAMTLGSNRVTVHDVEGQRATRRRDAR
jgi:hypothetical protein